ncbi:MAG: hypothetical protein AB3N14_10540 [Flavobacteriaceae bacterium]
MNKRILPIISLLFWHTLSAQDPIPLDTVNWDIKARSYVLESYKGKDAIYLQGGSITLKNMSFLNGTIEYDIYLKEAPAFPGVYFRVNDANAEQFYIRPHQSGNPDANQATPTTNGITPWQLYHGPKYSFPYEYHYDDWTHVKIVVEDNKAQVYLDHAEEPNLSWNLFHETKAGGITFTGGNAKALHLANISINSEEHSIRNFQPISHKAIEGLVPEWEISDMFEEKLLDDPGKLQTLVGSRKWGKKIYVEEGTAANISRAVKLFNGAPGNTVFARITIDSKAEQSKLFEFGYSDRVVVILNGEPVYRGTNRFRSRDYRYLGTIGLFDGVYLNLKKGKNTLLMAVSEDFGGWLVTGRFAEPAGVSVK